MSTFRRRPPSVAVILPAGGRGIRLGRTLPKQFLRIGGKTILQRTLEAFQHHPLVGEIILVVPGGFLARAQRLVRTMDASKVSAVTSGGRTRQESVWLGLCSLIAQPDVVLVHDAVRPFVSASVIQQVIRDAARYGAAVVGVRVKDTIKVEGRKNYYARTLPRESLWAVQTPQGFRTAVLLGAHKRAQNEGFVGTDEASLVERVGVPVRIVEGEERNIKITSPHDLWMATQLVRERGSRRLR